MTYKEMYIAGYILFEYSGTSYQCCKLSRNTKVDASELIDDAELMKVALVLVKDFRRNIFYLLAGLKQKTNCCCLIFDPIQ